MISPHSPESLRQIAEAITHVEKELAGLPSNPGYGREGYEACKAAEADLAERLRAHFPSGKIDDRRSWENSRVRIFGIQSTCTAGFTGALRNWCVAARKRLP